jgi:hypothetical protein
MCKIPKKPTPWRDSNSGTFVGGRDDNYTKTPGQWAIVYFFVHFEHFCDNYRGSQSLGLPFSTVKETYSF